MWRPLGPTSRATSSASMACSTCRPVPTARASRPSRAAPASSATATLTCSGSWSSAWSVLAVRWVSFGMAVPFWSSDLAVARHLPHGRSPGGDRHLNFYGNRDNLLLTVDCDYADLGGDYFVRRDADRARQRAVAQLQALGYQVTL